MSKELKKMPIMVKNGQNGQKSSKNGQKLSKIVKNVLKGSNMSNYIKKSPKYVQKISKLVKKSPKYELT